MVITALQVANHVRGELLGDANTQLSGIAPADSARIGDLTFADRQDYFEKAAAGQASAILAPPGFSADGKVVIRVGNPRVAIAKILPLFFPVPTAEAGVHPSAVVDPSAVIHASAQVGPGCVIGARVAIGARTILAGGNHIGPDCHIAEDVRLFPNVIVYAQCKIGQRVIIHAGTVIGSDGYGYVFDEGRHLKVLQVGNVVIEADVEIGANAAIDRAALGATVIGRGTKIDNLVHVAHNVVIGKNCLVMGQSGFAGSTKLGDYCVIASQSGIAGHLNIGSQAVVGAKSGVMRDIPEKGRVLGIPAAPDQQAKRQIIALGQLPELLKRTRLLEKELAELKALVVQPGAAAKVSAPPAT